MKIVNTRAGRPVEANVLDVHEGVPLFLGAGSFSPSALIAGPKEKHAFLDVSRVPGCSHRRQSKCAASGYLRYLQAIKPVHFHHEFPDRPAGGPFEIGAEDG